MAKVRIDLMRERMDAWASQTGATRSRVPWQVIHVEADSSHASRDLLEPSQMSLTGLLLEHLEQVTPELLVSADSDALLRTPLNPGYCLQLRKSHREARNRQTGRTYVVVFQKLLGRS